MEKKEFWRNEKVAFLALASLKGVGYWTLHKLAANNKGFKQALKNSENNELAKYFTSDKRSLLQEELWSLGIELARDLASKEIVLLFRDEPGFPEKIKNIPDPPYWIFIQGTKEILNMPAVSIVGSREITNDGVILSRLMVAALSDLRCVTISGLALGIDQICHSESIRYGIPTVAVLGTGILNNYPKDSVDLRDEILKSGGAVITEYLPKQSYSAENFVRRNRLQAALCDVLIPAEWKIKSGTAHTVKYAYSYDKLIINIFLPKTKSLRPEIVFSSQEYNALSYCVPQETQDLINKIIEQVCINYSFLKENFVVSENSDFDSEQDEKGQLALI